MTKQDTLVAAAKRLVWLLDERGPQVHPLPSWAVAWKAALIDLRAALAAVEASPEPQDAQLRERLRKMHGNMDRAAASSMQFGSGGAPHLAQSVKAEIDSMLADVAQPLPEPQDASAGKAARAIWKDIAEWQRNAAGRPDIAKALVAYADTRVQAERERVRETVEGMRDLYLTDAYKTRVINSGEHAATLSDLLAQLPKAEDR